MIDAFESMFGDRPETIRFDGRVAPPLVATFNQLLVLIETGFESGLLNDNPLASAALEETLIKLMLFSQPHEFSKFVQKPGGMVLPRHVWRAMRFIDENCAKPITSADVARHVGSSLRTLQSGFANFADTTINAYTRRKRLEGARQSLLSGSVETVQEAAKQWGFLNMSKFAKSYFEAFGERPSVTLDRSR